MMRQRSLHAWILPTVSDGLDVRGPSCFPLAPLDIKKMVDAQMAFIRRLCRLKRGVTSAIIFRELAEKP